MSISNTGQHDKLPSTLFPTPTVAREGLGDLAKLPLEIRTKTWCQVAEGYEHPYQTWGRFRGISKSINNELAQVFFAQRILTFDLRSYESKPGRWPSEFVVKDQYGNRWQVAPQFGGKYATLGGAYNIYPFLRLGLAELQKVRILLSAPNDTGEMLQAWNRMRWVACFLDSCATWHKVPLEIDLPESSEREWLRWSNWTGKSAQEGQPAGWRRIPDRLKSALWGVTGVSVFHFVLEPFYNWEKEVAFRLSYSTGGHNEWRCAPSAFSLLKRRERDRYEQDIRIRNQCPSWPRHCLDSLTTRSADLLRLEMMASTDARCDENFTLRNGNDTLCQTCIDQRIATSAWAPKDRDQMLQKIKKTKALLRFTETEEQQKARLQYVIAIVHKLTGPKNNILYNSGQPRRRYGRHLDIHHRHIYSHHLKFSINEDDPELSADFRGEVTDPIYGWPEAVKKRESYWESSYHWLRHYPTGIPSPTSPEHATVMLEFQYRHVHHPHELCRCKGELMSISYGCHCNCPPDKLWAKPGEELWARPRWDLGSIDYEEDSLD